MIPLRLQLRNFMCYGEDQTALVLDGIHVACLCGDNGHGKSTLLDATTWALWGRARAKTDDELVRIGKTEMEVELEFAVGGAHYRVIRKRSLRLKRGATALEFQVHGQAGYQPITGNSVHETQRKIISTLRMEYETFINSALLLQGRADEFTVRSPAERKKVLADVLGLGLYDELEARARELAREADQGRREATAALAQIDRELERRPEHQANRDRIAAELAAAERELSEQQLILDRLRAEKHALDEKSRRKEELARQCLREQRQLGEMQAQVVADREALAKHQAVLAERAAILAGRDQLLAARAQNDLLGRQASQLIVLQNKQAALDQTIAKARAALEKEMSVPAAAIAEAKTKMGRRPALQRELDSIHTQLAALADLEARRDATRATAQDCQAQISLLNSRNDQLKNEMALIKEKLALLGADGAACPVCESPLGPAGKRTLEGKYRAEGTQLGNEYRANVAQAKDLEARATAAQRQTAGIDQQLADRERMRRQVGVLERGLAEVDEAVRASTQSQEVLARLQARVDKGDYALDEQRGLFAVRAEIGALGYDAAAHERTRRVLASLAQFEARYSALHSAETAAAILLEKLRQNEAAVANRRQLVGDLTTKLECLGKEIAADSRVLADLANTEDRLDSLGRSSRGLREQLGRAEQLLQTCLYLEKERREKLAAQQQAAEEKSIYEELVLAFGKKGIQAMIIDSALPEIEDEANQLLARLTDNRMHVKLETQREAKSGDGLIETLDIKIADELGYRQYELYSGGEAFRVNFALRIALSKLLARRAGARLQTLIIDEGFGTQDTAGRERLVEAINAISPDFDCILVITHIQELKDAFPVRIDVVKGAEGSQIILTS